MPSIASFVPTAPPTRPQSDHDVDLLLEFVHERDAPCPRCGYNLRNLTQPVCPECREYLMLKVGVLKIRLHWLLLALAPGTFCAIMMGVFTIISLRLGPPPMGLEAVLTMTFIGISGTATAFLACRYRWFLRLGYPSQRTTAIIVWVIHLAAFGLAVARM